MRFYKVILFLLLVSVANSRGYLVILGGGTEGIGSSSLYPGTWSDSAFKWALNKVGPSKNFVIVYYDNYSNGSWWASYLRGLGHTGSVKVVTVRNRNDANNPSKWTDVYNTNTGIIWFPGGDQSNYIPILKNTKLGDTIKVRFYRDNICVGGTSAGSMILGEYVSTGSAWPNEAIRNPYNSYLTYDVNVLPLLDNYLVDTHIAERGRLGRMLAHLGRIKSDYNEDITVLGIDDCTALCVDSNLEALVVGSGSVSLLRATPSTRRVVQSGKKLVLTDLNFIKAGDRYTLDLNTLQILTIPPSAETISTTPPLVTPPPSVTFVVGGKPDQRQDQSAALVSFLSVCGQNPVITIITSNISMDTVANYRNLLVSLGASQVNLVELSESQVNNPTYAQYLSISNGFVFLKNNLQIAGTLLNSNNLLAQAYWQKVNSGTPQVFIGLDGWLVNEQVIYNTESGDYNAYYGKLAVSPGINLVRGLFISPAAFVPESSSPSYRFIESRVEGLFWVMTYYPGSLGILLDGASYEYSNDETWIKITPNGIVDVHYGGNGAPVIIIDAYSNQYRSRSSWTMRSSSSGPRQNGQLAPLVLHIIDSSFVFNLLQRGVLNSVEDRGEKSGIMLKYSGKNRIKISWDSHMDFQYARVYDSQGRKVKEFFLGASNETVIAIPGNKGVYFLELTGVREKEFAKFIIY
ncbi:MAG: cyanophycinase [Candidatus Hydrothermia bacterium]